MAGNASARLRLNRSATVCSPDTGPPCPAGETSPRSTLTTSPSPTFSAADSPAPMFLSPEEERDLQANKAGCSLSSLAWLLPYARRGFLWRTFPDCSAATKDETSPPSSLRWETSGTVWRGECWTAATSESPNDADECSLSAILEGHVPRRFSLSAKACVGILRRSAKRNRILPPALREALEAAVASEAQAPTAQKRLLLEAMELLEHERSLPLLELLAPARDVAGVMILNEVEPSSQPPIA